MVKGSKKSVAAAGDTPTKSHSTPGNKGSTDSSQTMLELKLVVEEMKGIIKSLRSEVSELSDAFRANTNQLSQIQEALSNEKHLNEELKLTISSQEKLINQLQLRQKQADERVLYLEQYSRKDVITLTGLEYYENEHPHDLMMKVCNIFNTISIPNYNDDHHPYFNRNAFSAIHRNGYRGNRGKPPTVTVKFISLMDKDLIMRNKGLVRKNNPNINLFHSMAKGTRDIKSDIESSEYVKFAEYNGINEGFSVCLVERKGWISKIRSRLELEKRLTELNVLNRKSNDSNDIKPSQVHEGYESDS